MRDTGAKSSRTIVSLSKKRYSPEIRSRRLVLRNRLRNAASPGGVSKDSHSSTSPSRGSCAARTARSVSMSHTTAIFAPGFVIRSEAADTRVIAV